MTAALLTLAAHGGLAWLLLESRGGERPVASTRELVSIPITLLPLTQSQPPVVDDEPTTEAVEPAAGRAPAPPRAPQGQDQTRPATAITLPRAPQLPDPPAARPPDAGEWKAQAEELAARFAEQHEAPPATIGTPPQPMREPCKPRESSFKWKSSSNSKGGSASLTLGWEEPEPNAHLFDDMMAGRRRPSSVPDPNVCD